MTATWTASEISAARDYSARQALSDARALAVEARLAHTLCGEAINARDYAEVARYARHARDFSSRLNAAAELAIGYSS